MFSLSAVEIGASSSLNISWEVLEFPDRWAEILIIFNGFEICLKASKRWFTPQFVLDAAGISLLHFSGL